ncbi:MAG: hypothetical protein E3J87_08595 [Candidatus Cloacimonadota bacterium]|nr:MAG: hypothetical protein E3J87_08595 [Candidatus Cloacimonadota bacterium]
MGKYIFFFLLIQNLFSKVDFSNDELFRSGNNLYKEGKYEESLENYKEIIDDGLVNGYLFYNLGNVYFRKGKIGYAILYYEKARKFLPRDREINDNLGFVKTNIQDRIEEKRAPFLLFILYVLLENFSLKEVTFIVSIIFSMTLICSILFFLKKNLHIIKNLSISFLVILSFSCFLLALKLRIVNMKSGIVLVEVVNVKSAPSEDATLEFVIHEGTEFQILESMKEFVKIRLKDGKSGWLTIETFGEI